MGSPFTSAASFLLLATFMIASKPVSAISTMITPMIVLAIQPWELSLMFCSMLPPKRLH